MATYLNMWAHDGYPTGSSMRVWVEFEVTYSATYYTYFELYDGKGNLIDKAKGTEYTLAGGDVVSGIYKTFNGLEPETDYYIVGSLWNAGTGVRLDIDEPIVEFTTTDGSGGGSSGNLVIEATPGSDTIYASVTTSGTVDMIHKWLINGEEWEEILVEKGDTGSWTTFEDLDPGTTYTITVNVYRYSSGALLDTGSITVTTTGVRGEISSFSLDSGSSSVTAYVDVDVVDGDYYVHFEAEYLDTTLEHDSWSFPDSRSLEYSFTGIPNNTEVKVTVRLFDNDTGKQLDKDSDTITTGLPERPDDWKWSSTVAKGSEFDDWEQVNDTKYRVYPLTAREWNRFIDRIFQFIDYKGNSYNGDISSLYVTKGNEMLAAEVEKARSLIAIMNPPTALPASVSTNKRITAAYINGLKDSLNSIE